MINNKERISGQSTIEYALTIICVVAALLAIHIYMKRAVEGRFRENVDAIGPQYDPGNTESSITLSTDSDVTTLTELEEEGDKIKTTTTSTTNSSTETRSGWETVGNLYTE